ncbi:MAG TPA: AMP-binding protein [Mycobacterium sp.]|nr:AMP-binding protein [Mycobacterium sp.]
MKPDVRQFLASVGYPPEWLADAERYDRDDAYVAFDPGWAETIPAIPRQSVDAIIQRQARERSDTPAIVYLGRTLTYGELHTLVGRAAAVLSGAGVGLGDVVAVMVPTSAMHWVIFFALARLGATHCGVNVMYRPEELRFLLGDVQPKAIVCADELLPVVEQAVDASMRAALFTVSARDLADPDFVAYQGLERSWNYRRAESTAVPALMDQMRTVQPILDSVSIDDVHSRVGQIIYTAGTTGTPKGVLQTHYNLVHNAVTHTIAMPGVDTPVTVSALPLFHTGGFFVYSLPTFVRGGTVIPRPLFDPVDTLGVIQEHAVNVLFGPPTLYAAFLARGVDRFDLSSLMVCATGAAPIPAALPDRWKQATGLDLHGGWGMSELNSLGTFNGLPGKPTPGTLGLPVVGEVRITVDGHVAARGIAGEIEFRGMQVSAGYLGRPEDTQAAFASDGWLKTGDVGLIDDADALHYVDRKKDLIFVSGYNISPAEIEATLLRHPNIADAAVVAERDPYRGEIPVAFVVGAVTGAEVEIYCRQHLAAIKTPRKVIVVDALPKNALGKTLKRQLSTNDGSSDAAST